MVNNHTTAPPKGVVPDKKQCPHQATTVNTLMTYVYRMIKVIVHSLIMLMVTVAAYIVVSGRFFIVCVNQLLTNTKLAGGGQMKQRIAIWWQLEGRKWLLNQIERRL